MPTYLQFVHQVDHALRLGRLRAGDQLPRIKDVTRTLAVNPDTVIKAGLIIFSILAGCTSHCAARS